MATYAIGDIQGCYKTLRRLLKRIAFDANCDRLLSVGDIVNRGPKSLDTLRYLKDLGSQCVTVLGNHDLHLLACAAGVMKIRKVPLLKPILDAKDSDELLEWLRERPVMYREGRVVLVHAGILPIWTIAEAEVYAREIESILRGKRLAAFLTDWYREKNNVWNAELRSRERACVALSAFTLMRMCSRATKMDLRFVGKPEDAPSGLTPWYLWPDRRSTDHTILFGHWAAQGVRLLASTVSLDSGCAWGGKLTVYRLEDGVLFSEPAAE